MNTIEENKKDTSMKKKKNKVYIIIALIGLIIGGGWAFKNLNTNLFFSVGKVIDNLDGVSVFYNGGVDHVLERNTAPDGYNLGLKYQCVEFVKRYYYEHFGHKMPDSYGHAKDFFDGTLTDGQKNLKRDLIQYTNPSATKPKQGDIVIFQGTLLNRYGHVAIISEVSDESVEIIQQNPGPFKHSRERFALHHENNVWKIEKRNLLGWLRKE